MSTTRDANLQVTPEVFEISHVHLTTVSIPFFLLNFVLGVQCAAMHVRLIRMERQVAARTSACSGMVTRPGPAAVALDSALAAMASPAKVSKTISVTGHNGVHFCSSIFTFSLKSVKYFHILSTNNNIKLLFHLTMKGPRK